MISSFSAVIACINNMGPGLNQVGPATNFASLDNSRRGCLHLQWFSGAWSVADSVVAHVLKEEIARLRDSRDFVRIAPDEPVGQAKWVESSWGSARAVQGTTRVMLTPQRLKTYIGALLADWPREFPVPDAASAA